jgi:hypothetical protein
MTMRYNKTRIHPSVRIHAVLTVLVVFFAPAWLNAQPINPQVFKKKFEEARKNAELVAKVRVLAAACTEAAPGKVGPVTLQVVLQVLESEKGPAKKGDLLVVAHKVTPPAGPGPRSYGYMSAVRQFPFTPGVKGDVALRWDNERRGYVVVAGWVEAPNNAEIPLEVGKAFVAGDGAPPK